MGCCASSAKKTPKVKTVVQQEQPEQKITVSNKCSDTVSQESKEDRDREKPKSRQDDPAKSTSKKEEAKSKKEEAKSSQEDLKKAISDLTVKSAIPFEPKSQRMERKAARSGRLRITHDERLDHCSLEDDDRIDFSPILLVQVAWRNLVIIRVKNSFARTLQS